MNKMTMLGCSWVAMAALTVCAADDVSKWDSRMADSSAIVDTSGVKWIDGKYLPVEGRWPFENNPEFYARLPNNLTTNVNGGVRSMRLNTAGMQFRFKTDSTFLIVRYTARSQSYNGSVNMTGVGKSGWDLYRSFKPGVWEFVASSHPSSEVPGDKSARMRRISWPKNCACLINLPLYDGVANFSIGIAKNAHVSALPPRTSGVNKPVVFYGTSITHGASASRPGLSFVNLVGRDLDVPVYNLGFSGSGVMEYELSDVLARIDASCYVMDCLWNMVNAASEDKRYPGLRHVEKNYEPFIRNLRAKRPGVPIVMAEQCDVGCGGPNGKDTFIRKLYEKLKAEGWKNLVYLPKAEMYSGDREGTVDGCHPNDLGMRTMANAFGKAVKEALKLK